MRSSLTRPSPSSPQVIVEAVPDSFSGFPGQSKKPDGFMEAFFGPNPNKGKVRERRWMEKLCLTTLSPRRGAPARLPFEGQRLTLRSFCFSHPQVYAPLQFRFLSLLPYMIPCMGAIAFTDQAFMAFPITWQIAVAISPVLQVFYSNSFIPFITFFTLFLAVVRNTKLNHFLRYNTMQAILLDICVMLAGLIMQYLPMFITVSFIGDLLETMTLMNALFAIGYCAWNVVQGQYPEIPIITEAVYAQVRDQ